jgi:ElaB/YqjD/DUF883 family membrane-anchored ribosome-binding protein
MSTAEPAQPEPTDTPTEQLQVQRDIEQAREELGGIAEALAEKANLRAHAQRKLTGLREQARMRRDKARTVAVERYRAQPAYIPVGAGAAVVLIIGAIVGAVLWRRR